VRASCDTTYSTTSRYSLAESCLIWIPLSEENGKDEKVGVETTQDSGIAANPPSSESVDFESKLTQDQTFFAGNPR